MKTLFNAAILLGACALIAARSVTSSPATPSDDMVTGAYIEARDATVWGGACHISAQADSSGSHLVQAWAFDGGDRAVLLTEGESNLDAHRVFYSGEAAPRRALLVVDGNPSAVKGHLAGLLGEAQVEALRGAEVVERPISFQLEGDDFAVQVEGLLALEGQALADRACCTMPESRWYSPQAALASSVVGNPEVCRFIGDAAAGFEPWTYTGENSVYVGRF